MTMDIESGSFNNPLTALLYDQPAHAYDEAFTDQRKAREHWRYLLHRLQELGDEGILMRQQRAQHILREDGAIYDLTSDHQTAGPRVWSLDILPHLISHAQWAETERGLVQRSTLFDAIFKDLYGAQELIKSGTLPAAAIFNNPSFLRQCHGIKTPGQHQLLLHAVDMVKGSDGHYRVLTDRAQIPSGAGYALENRTVMSRVMPNIYRDSQVRRLAPFFQSMKTMLSSLAGHWTDTPNIVILTPGVYSSNYFEQAFLTNYLGYPLVQGRDLTVRNGSVWMKSLNGLVRVDVIVRHVDDDYCDQAELRTDSLLGVAGLLEVARAGNVVLANPLGSGLLEAPTLHKYLPDICQFLLGEPLITPSVTTYWCGDADDLNYVLAHLDQLIIKPVSRKYHERSIYGHTLDKQALAEVKLRIQQQPQLYVAQDYLTGSMTPVWQESRLTAKPSLLRTFTCASEQGYKLMPGGLLRTGDAASGMIASNLSMSNTKDTWVLAEKPEQPMSLLQNKPAPQAAMQGNIPSRVVENLFWMGRYAERIEMNARMLRTLFNKLQGLYPLSLESRRLLLQSISIQTQCSLQLLSADDDLLNQPDMALAAIITNGQQPGSVKSDLYALLNCSEQAKERLSSDSRIIVNGLYDQIHQLDQAYQFGLPLAPEEPLNHLVTALLALAGLYHESTLRGQSWSFQQIGRCTERALKTATLLRASLSYPLAEAHQQEVLESILLSSEALISFHRRYKNYANLADALELLITDKSNPRSLMYQFEQLNQCVVQLPRSAPNQGVSTEYKLIQSCLIDIKHADLDKLASIDSDGNYREQLNQFMSSLIERLEQLTTVISDKYFDHTTEPHKLVHSSRGPAL
ncbi:circularly permuted type 2 ATP-grasp protein [Reinekea thalattae]|uniref:Uncharacterized protein n=1 Tax=Reinekea thalattae TaxID=2593301 RepID=A0A5C8Z937_9GAMM|nr:circularly permuted type 2 ATP-grasp protein [Reinekea thalattae]TXR54207.1 hypothetical protein FME95_06630 [Reinekea thalattae]